MQVFDSQHHPLLLGSLLAKRGEGSVYDLPENRGLVAKVYHRPTPERSDKLRAMVAAQTPGLSRLTAWPVETIHAKQDDVAIGFLMPKIAGVEEVHVLYGPRSRKERFPNATWRFLLHTATNVARSFAVVHEHGHVIGDVNHGNLLVTQNATVSLIDCDSFHLRLSGRLFPCGVGVSTHTPPELQDTNFARADRVTNHDNFGLAVLLFQILFMGRHPFSGQFSGKGDMPIERAIKEYRFAYGVKSEARQMQPPPGTLPLSAITDMLVCLFDKAFLPQPPGALRPEPREWVRALEELECKIAVCSLHPGHHYHNDCASCPWCEIESATNALLFYIPAGSALSLPNIEDLWATIVAVPPPLPAPTLPKTKLVGFTLPEPIRELASKKRNVLLRALHRRVIDEQVAQVETQYKNALAGWTEIVRVWSHDPGYNEFQVKLSVARTKVRAYHEVDTDRAKALSRLVTDQENLQKQRFLDGFPLTDGMVEGIGLTKIVTLNSYGIYTAKDIVAARIRLVPGFGSAISTRLVEWRQSVEKQFRFVPDKEPDRRDTEPIENRAYTTKIKIAQSLAQVPGDLRRIKEQMTVRRVALSETARQKSAALAKAEAAYNAVE